MSEELQFIDGIEIPPQRNISLSNKNIKNISNISISNTMVPSQTSQTQPEVVQKSIAPVIIVIFLIIFLLLASYFLYFRLT